LTPFKPHKYFGNGFLPPRGTKRHHARKNGQENGFATLTPKTWAKIKKNSPPTEKNIFS
jgi:hypothetical protein